MKVLVDTSVWSLVLRRKSGSSDPSAKILEQLVAEDRALIMGPIRQELLSGIGESTIFEWVAFKLRGFADLPVESSDYVRAAQFSNACRAKGVQGSATDFLICAASFRHEVSILTTDRDFTHYSRVLPIRLFDPSTI